MTEAQAMRNLLDAACWYTGELRVGHPLARSASRLKKAAHAWVKAQTAARVAKSIDAKKIGTKGSDRSHIHRNAKMVLDTPSWMRVASKTK